MVLGFWRDRKDDEQEFMRVLVGRKMNLNKYNYVASKLEAYYEDLYIECP